MYSSHTVETPQMGTDFLAEWSCDGDELDAAINSYFPASTLTLRRTVRERFDDNYELATLATVDLLIMLAHDDRDRLLAAAE